MQGEAKIAGMRFFILVLSASRFLYSSLEIKHKTYYASPG